MTDQEVTSARWAVAVSAFWERLKTDRLLQAQVLLWTAIVARVVVLMVISRGWFFTNDDWDYITRDGVLSIARPHSGHITATVAGLGMVAKQIGGLDYWPIYPFVVSLAWPAVGYAAWWTWRRSNVAPMPAAIGAIVIVWLVSGAYMQFSHIAMAMTLASLIIAVRIDEERLTPGRGVMSFLLSMVAVFAGSSGVVATTVRGTLAVGYRKWTGVVGALPALAVYFVVRTIVGGSQGLDFSFGFGDLWTIIQILGRLIGPGLHWVFFMPEALAEVATVLLILAAIGGLVWARFSYRATTWILSAAAFVGTVAVVRWLNEPAKLAELLDGRLDTRILGVRYANLPLVLLLMTTLPLILLWMQRGKIKLKRTVVGGIAVFMVVGGVVQTSVMLDEISDKSINKATEAAAVADMIEAGEPIAYPIGRRAGGTNGGWFTYRNVLGLQAEGRLPEIQQSDIYRVRDVPEADMEKVRGNLRFTAVESANPSAWADVGLPDQTGCVLVTDQIELLIVEPVRLELVLGEGNEQRKPVTVVWTDEFGFGSSDVRATEFNEEGRVYVRTAAPLDDGSAAQVTLVATNVELCLTN